jgi:hypothetical protein
MPDINMQEHICNDGPWLIDKGGDGGGYPENPDYCSGCNINVMLADQVEYYPENLYQNPYGNIDNNQVCKDRAIPEKPFQIVTKIRFGCIRVHGGLITCFSFPVQYEKKTEEHAAKVRKMRYIIAGVI